LTEIKLKKGEPIEKALRRLKKRLDREGTLRTVRAKRTYEKPSETRRRKEKVSRFSAMLARRSPTSHTLTFNRLPFQRQPVFVVIGCTF